MDSHKSKFSAIVEILDVFLVMMVLSLVFFAIPELFRGNEAFGQSTPPFYLTKDRYYAERSFNYAGAPGSVFLGSLTAVNSDNTRSVSLNLEGLIRNKIGWVSFSENPVGLLPGQAKIVNFTITIPGGVCDDTYEGLIKATLNDYTGAPPAGGIAVNPAVALRMNLVIASGTGCTGDPIPGLGDPTYVPPYITQLSASGFPVISNTMNAVQQADDMVYVTYNVRDIDDENDVYLTKFQYSRDGITWANMTMGTGGDGKTNLTAPPGGVDHIYSWNLCQDLYNVTDDSVWFRFSAHDGTGEGNTAISDTSFAIDCFKGSGGGEDPPPPPPQVVCGDGVKATSEECDDGNNVNGDGCSSVCLIEEAPPAPQCGNGAVETGEECDDGNTSNGDGCSASCLIEEVPPACGDGNLDAGEQCDDGNTANGDGCSSTCLSETFQECGNNILETGEECDDGNILNGDGCSSLCVIELPPECGNGLIEGDEECDDGNTASGDGCSSLCVIEIVPVCGNGLLEGAEECDDGNTEDGDGCSSLCISEVLPECGNSILEVPEECDDGNTEDGDGCSSICEIEIEIPLSLSFQVHPEKRIPATNNWGTTGLVNVYQFGNFEPDYSFQVEIGNDGFGTIEEEIPPGNYQVSFKGLSHLTRFLRNMEVNLEDTEIPLDFTFGNTFALLSGDIAPNKDDYVNSMDIAAAASALFKSDANADLNKDTIVNSLDLSMMFVNLYLSGEARIE